MGIGNGSCLTGRPSGICMAGIIVMHVLYAEGDVPQVGCAVRGKNLIGGLLRNSKESQWNLFTPVIYTRRGIMHR